MCWGHLASTPAQAQLTNIDLATNFTLTRGVSVYLPAADRYGIVGNAGDINGDGYDDMIIGAFQTPPAISTGVGTGGSYIIYGRANFSNIDLTNFPLSQGFFVAGATAGDGSGSSVSSAGDVNNDGYADFVIGSPGVSPKGRSGAGITYVIYGGTSLTNIDLATLSLSLGFSIYGASGANFTSTTGPDYSGDQSGCSVSAAGDVNNDGYPDIIVGAYSANPSERKQAGASYVIYGGANLTNIDLATNFTLSRGFSIYGAGGGDLCGFWVSGAGDVNGDDYSDVFVGSDTSASYLIYGGPGGVMITSSTTTSTSTSTLNDD